MKCPVCREPDLVMTSREGIEIDYCPQCRGVWLDRGELDKIIDRSAAAQQEYRETGGPRPQPYYGHKHHKPKSILKEVFDF